MRKILDRNKILLTLLLTQGVSLIGSRMSTVALGIWLYQQTGKATALLLMPFFNEMPSLLFGHFIGAIVDRYSRKQLMILADVGQAIGSLLLLFSIAFQYFQLWHLYVIVFIQGVFASIQGPAADASITLLTNNQNRGRINGFKELTFPAVGILAPLLAGLLYVAKGLHGVLLVDMFTFVMAMGAIMLLDIPTPEKTIQGRAYKGNFIQEAYSGYRFLYQQKSLLYLVAYFAVVNFLINGPLELVIPYILTITESETYVALMLSIMSIATAIGALIMTIIGRHTHKIPWLFGGVLLSALGFLGFGYGGHRMWLILTIVMVMLPLPIVNALLKTLLQDHVPEDMQGRIFGVVYQVAYGIAPLSFLLTGPLVDHWLEPMMLEKGFEPGRGMGLLLIATGFCLLAVTLIFYSKKALRKLR